MNHERIGRALLIVTAAYIVVLAVWVFVLLPRSPDGTVPYQIAGLVAGFGAALGLAMMVAGRPTAEDRRLLRDGVEGWAVIEDVRTVGTATAPMTEVDVVITVPGSDSYPGLVRRREPSSTFEVGATIPVKVDPADRTRIWM
ncbi:hypothetical protein ASG56_07535 [Rhodococcus sp. Leaf7]|uniref:hypothetical protein n=1 Tax=unclassified Rhodococcus (in: high G+C Gram-positive bacteria) TaxID=192944 RepID=UPI0005ACA325|nr:MULTISPECIES: hypothetical protein [unclassified Rhodococcus (in: high G+C Gram-positive bacteria)]KIQ18155.1 hypothetical protein RU01_08815 [Rhodococcus sp. MEB064]KQU07357.1 hypothetical protein ASG56_07535 [Rhodococcus sp. Leaf7]KQU42877.1 hypothetical protein ASG64_07535 [Rhodococcus sp. Leaf247]